MTAPIPSTSPTPALPAARTMRHATVTAPQHGRRVGHLGVSTSTFLTRPATAPEAQRFALPAPAVRESAYDAGAATTAAPSEFPDVWLIALATAAGGLRPIEGAGRNGAVRVARPYGHLRAMRPVLPEIVPGATPQPEWAKVWADAMAGLAPLGSASSHSAAAEATTLPAERLIPQVVSAVEVETDAGVFRVERLDELLTHSDLAWAIANLESGEPDGVVPLPRKQLAMLLTLLPPPEDPDHPESDPTWGWAHRMRGPWERGALHSTGKLGRLIAVDPDLSGRGMHRACFEMLGTEEVVWAAGVPCFRAGSVYELVPLTRRGSASRWLSWPLSKARRRAGMPERPKWEIARAVHRVGAPRWPLAGVVEPLGPLGVAG